jgi:hypothetical protein
MRTPKQPTRRAPLLVLFVAAVAVAIAATGGRAAFDAERDAAGDVRLLGRTLEETHPDLFRHVTRKRFRTEVERLARQARALGPNQLLVGLMRIAALPGPRNGHTGIVLLAEHRRELHLYPLRLYDFADGVHLVDEEAGRPELVGARVTAIAGVPTARVLELVRPLVPHDNDSGLRGYAPHYAVTAEVLDGLGIADGVGAIPFRFATLNGESFELSLEAIPAKEYVAAFSDPLHGHYPAVLPSRPKPLYLANAGRELWLTKLASGRAIYVGYNSALASTVAVANRLARLVSVPKVGRVIVDVRLNGGGNNAAYVPLLQALGSRSVDRRGRLYLLFGRATFSAAGNFATDVESQTSAISVGEPTGGGVNQYGDSMPFTLPSTGVQVFVATEYVARAPERDRRLAVVPDVPVAVTSADFRAERDPVLERALRGL